MGSGGICEGAAPPREQVVRLGSCSPKWGLCPHSPPRAGAPPCAPGEFMRGWQPLPPPVGLPGPHPGFLSFHDERNQRRAGAAPLDPLRGARCPPCGVAAPPNRVSTTKIDRFATLSLWANRSCFFLWFHRGNTLCFQSVARQIPYPPRMLEGLSHRNQYR